MGAWRSMLLVGFLLCLARAGPMGGQVPAADPGTLTLHVYENLIQLPVLVLSRSLGEMPGLPASRFTVRLDEGPPFPPTHVRREGDDPIALAVLLDRKGVGEKEAAAFAASVGGLAGSLRAEDRVAMYTLGCTLRGSAAFQPGTREGVEQAVAAGLTLPPTQAGGQPGVKAPCVGLWDALAYVILRLRVQPGRRVILVVTNGEDAGSRNAPREVWRFAGASAVTMFGLMDEGASGPEHSLERLCDLTGGLALHGSAKRYGERVPGVVGMVRGRYIVEFPRAMDATAGMHALDVRVAASDAVIRTSGIGVPVADPKIRTDPTTVPNDATRAPMQGTRRGSPAW